MKIITNPIFTSSRRAILMTVLCAMILFGMALQGADLDTFYADELGYVPIDKLAPFEYEDVMSEIVLKSSLIKMIATLTPQEEKDFKDMMRLLKLIRVVVFDVNETNVERMEENAVTIIDYLDDHAWERIVFHKEEGENVGIYIRTVNEDTINGLALVVREKGDKMVLINIVGEINLNMLGRLGSRFDIPQLEGINGDEEEDSE